MKNKKCLAIASVLAAAFASVGYGAYEFGARHGAVATPPAGPSASAKTPLYWHDPMVPGQRFDKPGKSPFMDMQLVPVYADSDTAKDDSGGVRIDARIQQNLGVRTALVTSGKLAAPLAAVGNVAYNERDVAVVQARSGGYLERLSVRAPFEAVRKGQVLAQLYVPEWIAAQEEFLAARRMQGADTASLVDAARQRMRLTGMDETQVRLVETSGTVHARLSLTAPISGVVAELGAREGMTVAPGATLFRINGLASVWVNAELPETALAKVRAGTPVEARAQALPDKVFQGKVSAILPEINTATRTVTARIELANPNGQLLPGMFATLNFAPDKQAAEILLLPSEALIQTGTRKVVMLAGEGGHFTPVEVQTGAEGNGMTEIRTGLLAGQKVVVSGQFLVDSEASLKGTTTRMGGAQAADVAPAAAAAAAAAQHHAVGTVEQIGKQEITISHGPVATLQWGQMTMGFKLPPAGLPAPLRVGDKVAFDFSKSAQGGFAITAISVETVATPVKASTPAASMGGMAMPGGKP